MQHGSMDAVRVRQLVSSFEGGSVGAVGESVEFVHGLQGDWAVRAHTRLCAAMLKAGGREGDLLHALGPSQALSVVYSNARDVSRVVIQWLAGEVLHLLSGGKLVEVLLAQCREVHVGDARLTAQQDQLVGVLCRLPDVLSNRLQQSLDPTLLPQPYFSRLGMDVFSCLERVHYILREASGDCSLLFPAAVIGKAALLGQKDSVFSCLVPSLQESAECNPLWRRLAQTLFSRIPSSCLEPVLDAVVQYVSPSLLSSCPLHWLLGDLVSTSQRAYFLLTHKFLLVKVPPSPHAAFTLVGYLASSSEGEVLGKSLQSVLRVWSDTSALRHMDLRQHLWLSRIAMLGVVCLPAGERSRLRPALQRLVMAGLQAHLDSPLQERRHIGMAVGEGAMHWLNPSDSHHLKFEYEPSEEVRTVQQLARPVEEQEAELRVGRREVGAKEQKAELRAGRGEVRAKEQMQPQPACQPSREQFGEGLVKTTECSDTDSDDDDLVPYAMGDDPDSTEPKPPRYLRTLIQVLVSSDATQQHSALKVSESLIISHPPDLCEVCVELGRALLHLTDSYALSDFALLRHRAMVALTVTCPSPLAHFLTSEFYAPHYTLRQRMDILEVLSSAALELSRPQSDSGDNSDSVRGVRGVRDVKPWEEEVQQRLRAKTRIISKGPSKPSPIPSPNLFAPIAPAFFFPLMGAFDHPVATLDLLGQDSLLLGSLLHTLGTIMYCAMHTPLAPAMAAALLDFLWALRYHSEGYVRQGVLFALSMLLVAAPTLPTGLEGELAEAIHWVEDVRENDADAQCRSLAQQTLGLLGVAVQQARGPQ